MPTVYEGLRPLLVKAEVSCFKLKGEDFHTRQCEIRIEGVVQGVQVATNCALLAVFDGHGGRKAADFANKQVQLRVVERLRDRLQPALDSADAAAYADLGDADGHEPHVWLLEDTIAHLLPSVLHDVFGEVHREFVAEHTESGTTATVVLICGHELISANVGDSLAFLDTGAQVLQLSGNHRIDDSDAERARLVAAGGDIAQADLDGTGVGPLRVWPGGLAFSRSLGDYKAGERVLPDPTVCQATLGGGGARIILASDGVWDAITSGGKGAARRVRNQACTKAASNLRSFSKEQRDRDDITVIVADAMPDASARVPPALVEGAAAVSGSVRHDCASSVASVAHDSHRKVWRPLEAPDTWREVWQAKMAARAEALEAAARLAEAEQHAREFAQTDTRSQSLNDSRTSITELSNVQLDPLMWDGGDEGDEEEWEEVPLGRKAKDAAAAAAAAEAEAAAAAERRERCAAARSRRQGRGRGRRGRGAGHDSTAQEGSAQRDGGADRDTRADQQSTDAKPGRAPRRAKAPSRGAHTQEADAGGSTDISQALKNALDQSHAALKSFRGRRRDDASGADQQQGFEARPQGRGRGPRQRGGRGRTSDTAPSGVQRGRQRPQRDPCGDAPGDAQGHSSEQGQDQPASMQHAQAGRRGGHGDSRGSERVSGTGDQDESHVRGPRGGRGGRRPHNGGRGRGHAMAVPVAA